MKKITTFFAILLAFMVTTSTINVQANAASKNKSKGKVLLVASSTNTLQLKNGQLMKTGYFLNELAVPAQRLIEEGYEVVVATPSGEKPDMDQNSNNANGFDDDEAYQSALEFVNTYPSMQDPISLQEAVDGGLDQYAGIYVPGGHAPMNDLMQDPNLGTALQYFHEESKPTAFLCHGVVAALASLTNAADYRTALVNNDYTAQAALSADWQYAGYRMTSFSNREEYPGEQKLNTQVPFYVADALQTAGAIIEHGPLMQSHVVRDRELITGQNPASAKDLAEELVNALKEKNNNK